ncbi:MAG: NAD(P)H-hydrate dehydratase [Acidobacteria bacterium]|nr:NAD(P)H-hydrate dehydratase [Acidobacteriota bacterium]
MPGMVILTAEQMRRIDARAESDHGVPADALMDNAGREIALALARRFPDLARRRTLILCGKGNNGGDGLTAARHLKSAGIASRVVLLCPAKDLRGAAAGALSKARAAGITVEEIRDDGSWASVRRALGESDLIVDALLGTGARGGATGLLGEAIEAINGAGSTVVSVDVPSGLGEAGPAPAGSTGPVVEADVTIALAALKTSLVFQPGARYAGEIEVVDIGIPAAAIAAEKADLHWIDAATAASWIPRRDRASHKGDFGHVLVVAGSRGKSGAAVLLARACLRSGAGLVTIASPESAQPIIAAAVPEAMTAPLPETPSGSLAGASLPLLLKLLDDRDVLATGPGLGMEDETAATVRSLVAACRKPMVLDADALNAIAIRGTRPALDSPAVVTPHPGEAARLLGVTSATVSAERLSAARQLARDLGAAVVLKGWRTLTASPDGMVRVNSTGNPGMATGGSGDSLTGVVAAWLAQGLDPATAAALSAFVHGLAGDLAAADLGEISMIAGDIVDRLPAAYRLLLAAPRPGR